MYRINLFPEALEKRKEGRRRVGRTLIVSALIGLEAVLLLLVGLSGLLLREQASSLRADVERLATRSSRVSQPSPELEITRAMLSTRAGRIDWSPKLAALPRAIDASLLLTEVTAQTGEKGRPTRLEITGSIRSEGGGMEPVSRFLESLRSDPFLADDFPVIKLGTIEGEGAGRFQILCESVPVKP
jgi:hypothetical protein